MYNQEQQQQQQQEEQKQPQQQIQLPLQNNQQEQQQQQQQNISEAEFFKNKNRVENYRIITFLEKTSRGTIHICQRYPDQFTNYIIKIYRNSDVLQQIEVIQFPQLQHKNIIQTVDTLSNVKYQKHTDFDSFQTISAVVQPFCANGCLFEYLAQKKQFSPSIARALFKNLIIALEYVHSQRYVHRNVCIENLLLDNEFNLYLSDFKDAAGFSKYQKEGYFKTKLGNQVCQGPEFNYISQMYEGVPADIFAAGVCLFAMQVGYYPFQRASDKDRHYLLLQIQKERFWEYHRHHLSIGQGQDLAGQVLNDQFKDLIEGMLIHDPQSRLTIEQIKNHQWFLNQEIASQQDIKDEFRLVQQQVENIKNRQNQNLLTSKQNIYSNFK